MEDIKQYYYKRFISDPTVKSGAIITVNTPFSPLIHGFDMLVLVITEGAASTDSTFHYIRQNLRIQERHLDIHVLEEGIISGKNRHYIPWILQGEIFLDRNLYLESLRHRLLEFPQPLREQKLFVEFNLFLKSYLQSKQYIQEGHVLDAYSNILKALNHWACVAIIEAGFHPEITLWSQIRKINPGVYKLYEELTSSSETLDQRVRLVLLACEFSVMSKMQKCCALLLRIMKSRKQAWSADELMKHPEITAVQIDIGLLLNKMVAKSLIKEVVAADDADLMVVEIRYAVK